MKRNKDSVAGMTLEQKTLIYWQMSQCWNGQTQTNIPVGTALHLISDVTADINPQRPIFKMAKVLLDEIIDDTPRTKGSMANPIALKRIESNV